MGDCRDGGVHPAREGRVSRKKLINVIESLNLIYNYRKYKLEAEELLAAYPGNWRGGRCTGLYGHPEQIISRHYRKAGKV